MSRPLNIALAAAVSLVVTGVASAAPMFVPAASGFNHPVYVTATPDPTDSRLFVVERNGTIKIVQNGVTNATPFLDISSQVASENQGGENGMASLAFDPNFSTNGRFYVTYTDIINGRMVLARYNVNPSNPNLAGSGQVILDTGVGHLNDIHTSGWIGFRPGDTTNLYMTIGENQAKANSVPLNNYFGKIVRLNVSGNGAPTPAAGNPFASDPNPITQSVWDSGFRNAWRASFDRVTGDFFIGDVGDGTAEEIDAESASDPGGHFYGWPAREGLGAWPGASSLPPGLVTPEPKDPLFSYLHADPTWGFPQPGYNFGAVSGGYVYRGSLVPELYGSYLFGDLMSGAIGSLKFDGTGYSDLTVLTPQLNPNHSLFSFGGLVSWGEDSRGELYAVNYSTGTVFALVPEPSALAMVLMPGLVLLKRRHRTA